MHALHFEELSRIWEADRRIPTISSRRHWAEARNVNPVNVHSWWYRRRPLAKKLKIKIPREEYDLDVGTPPLLPAIEEIKVEVPSEVPISDLSQTLSPLPGISDAETSIPSSNAVDVVENSSSDDLSAECMRSSSPLQEIPWLAPSSTSRDSSPLPPSSPCPPTPPPCLLTLPEDIIVKDDTAGPLLGIVFRIHLLAACLCPSRPDSSRTRKNLLVDLICASQLFSPA